MTKTNQNVGQDDPYFAGDDLNINVTVLDEDGNPKDITGATLTYKIYNFQGSQTDLLTKTTGGGGVTITDGPNGKATVQIDSTDTSDFEAMTYPHVLKVDISGDTTTAFEGYFKVYT